MTRGGGRFLAQVGVLIAAAIGVYVYYNHLSSDARIHRLEEEVRAKQQVIGRLEGERRVAEMLVTDQQTVGGVLTTTLLFVEYDRAGHQLPARPFTVRGVNTHIDAMVIKFDHAYVEAGDAIKGKSIALFTRIYGDATSPDAAVPIDPRGGVPQAYHDVDPRAAAVEAELWGKFWELAYDDKARAAAGVRAVVGQGVWEPLRKDTLYTLTIENDGGLSLAREPLQPIYRDAMAKRPQ